VETEIEDVFTQSENCTENAQLRKEKQMGGDWESDVY